MNRFQPSSGFTPSKYSYGAEELAPAVPTTTAPAPTDDAATGKMIADYMPAVKSFFGLDDPRDKVAKLESRIRTLSGGGIQAQAVALQVCGVCSVSTALEKTREQLRSAQSAATQLKTRDAMYTALVIAGVAASGMAIIWMGTKTWGSYQQTQIQREELKQLRSRA